MKPTSSALPAPAPPRPKHWERLVLFAYLRMMGSTQKDAGSAVGRSRRTAQAWEENKPLYAQAREEARRRWLAEVSDAARQALLATLRQGHGELAWRVLERLDADLAPTKDHAPALPDIHVHLYSARERLSERLTHLATRHAEDATNGS
jgi:hypothetical protein